MITIKQCVANIIHSNLVHKAVLLFVSLFCLSQTMAAQTGQISKNSDGLTPPGLAPGAPAGAYSLSEFENVNLFNGKVSFTLPIVQKGRGGASISLPIKINSPGWLTKHELQPYPNPNGGNTFIHVLNADGDWWNNTNQRPILAGGMMYGRYVNVGSQDCSGQTAYVDTNTFLTFVAPDGTEYQFADKYQGGLRRHINCSDWGNNSRDNIFIATDGSGATFVSQVGGYPYLIGDQSMPDDAYRSETFPVSGCVMLKDGTRYDITNSKVTKMRDRNGNEAKFEDILYYGPFGPYVIGRKIFDSLNREIRIDYNASGDPMYGQHDKITIKGYGGADRIIRISYTFDNNQWLRTTRPTDPTSPWSLQQLFPKLDNVGPVGGPVKVSAIWLPDGKRYRFWYNVYCELARVELPTGGAIEYDYQGGGVFDATTQMYLSEVGEYAITRYPANVSTVPRVGIYRRLTERRAYKEGDVLEMKTTYGRPNNNFSNGAWTSDLTVEQCNAAGVLLSRNRHCFYGSAMDSTQGNPAPYAIPNWQDGREYKTEVLSLAATPTTLRQVENTWAVGTVPSTLTFGTPPMPIKNIDAYPRITQTKTTLNDSNQNSCQTFVYDSYNNQTEAQEFGYGVGTTQGSLLRRTVTAYVASLMLNGTTYNYATDNTIHLRSLPASIRVYDAVNNQKAETLFEYDLYDASPNHAALIDRPNISCLNPTFTTACLTRGNVTKVRRWLAPNVYAEGWAQYDIAGNVVKTFDANSNCTTFDYADVFGIPDAEARTNTAPTQLAGKFSYAFPTKITNALLHCAYAQFDYCLGAPVDFEDPNGTLSSYCYNDPLDRPTQAIRAANVAALKNQTTFSYDPDNRLITSTSDRDNFGDNILKSQVLYDGLGRTVESRTYESLAAYIRTNTVYDGMGRVCQISNPYRSGDTVYWTTTTYDALSRAVSVTSPDGATVTSAYDGSRVRVQDQDNKMRASETDALGRLISVWELKAMDGDTVSLSWPRVSSTTTYYGYLTNYAYDTLDNLTQVSQVKSTAPAATQTRTFTYDELKRLKTANNPESGTVSYQYDNNSNLTLRTDARGISTTLSYDALNRLKTKTYSDTTPTVKYCYDNNTQFAAGAPAGFDVGSAIGGLVAVNYGTASSTGDYYGYDQLGRVARKTQRIDTTNYPVTATYNRASAMTGETYPSGQTVSYAFDNVGRLINFNGNLGTGGAAIPYAAVTQFSAASQIMCETFGTTDDLYLKMAYNKRLQMVDLRLADRSSAQTNVDWNRGKLEFFYGPNSVNGGNPLADDLTNNGNVRRSVHSVPTAIDGSGVVTAYAVPQRQDYTYDELNRILSVTENQMPTGGAWQASASQNFGYDKFGNRAITGVTGPVNGLSLAFNPANNRISTANYGFDAAGNLTNENGSSRTYDAENRIMSATNGSYVYDGDGKRVKRTSTISSQTQTSCYVYGIGGELLAEYLSTAPAPTAPTKQYGYQGGKLLVTAEGATLKWMVSDHLGSTRMEVAQAGSLASVTRHDYMPFGEELYAGIRRSGNTGMYGYESQPPASSTRQRFTNKERDTETNLDYFGARYYASIQGRFVSPDEFTGGAEELYWFDGKIGHNPTFYAELALPQSLNKYTYCLNNPLRFVDPDGHQEQVADFLITAGRQLQQTPLPVAKILGGAAALAGAALVGANWESIKNKAKEFGASAGAYNCDSFMECGYVQQMHAENSQGNAGNQSNSSQGNKNDANAAGKPPGDDKDKKPLLGEKGTQTTSLTVGKGKGWRVDVENPNPGQRAGQVHYQSGDTKYLYDTTKKEFVGASKTENKTLLSDPNVQKAIKKALKVLGE